MKTDFLNRATGRHFLMQEPRTDLPCTPNSDGEWFHPDFRWGLAPDDSDVRQLFADAGYEICVVERDLPLFESEQGCIGWKPTTPGDGWFLVIIQNSEDGPQAIFARRKALAILQQHHNGNKRALSPESITDCDAGWGFKQTPLFTQIEVDAAIDECHQCMSIHLWTVYDHPSDYPDGFIARRWQASSYRTESTNDVLTGPTLESVRDQLPKGLHNIGRKQGDDSKIVECWV